MIMDRNKPLHAFIRYLHDDPLGKSNNDTPLKKANHSAFALNEIISKKINDMDPVDQPNARRAYLGQKALFLAMANNNAASVRLALSEQIDSLPKEEQPAARLAFLKNNSLLVAMARNNVYALYDAVSEQIESLPKKDQPKGRDIFLKHNKLLLTMAYKAPEDTEDFITDHLDKIPGEEQKHRRQHLQRLFRTAAKVATIEHRPKFEFYFSTMACFLDKPTPGKSLAPRFAGPGH